MAALNALDDPAKKPQALPPQGAQSPFAALGAPQTPYPTASPTASAAPAPTSGAPAQAQSGAPTGYAPPPQGQTAEQKPAATSLPPVTPTPTPAAAAGDPNAALGQVQAAFQAKFNRAMSPEEQQALIKYVGYSGGAVTPDILQKALGAVGQYTGNLQNPGLGGPGGPAAPTPVTAKSLEQQQREQLMKLLRGETPVGVDLNNDAVKAERSHFDRINAQATGRQRLAAAERGAARGTLGAGGFDAELSGIENESANRQGGFEAELYRNERQGQIDRLMAGLGMTQQYGATQLQGQLGRGQLSLGYLNSMLNDKQAGNALGFNYTALQQKANNDAIMAILNGF